MVIIGITGLAEAGKTTIAQYMSKEYGFVRTAFAEPLKQMLERAGMCTYEELYVKKTDQSRWLLQKIGTDIFRKQIDPLFWVNKCEEEILRLHAEFKCPIVVDDIRFPEEAERIKHLGGTVIKVIRSGHVSSNAGNVHESERFVNDIVFDHGFAAESGDVRTLLELVDGYMKREGFQNAKSESM